MIVYHSHSILASICKLKNKAKAAPIKAAHIKAAPIKAAPIKAAPIKAAPIKAAPIKAASIKAAPIKVAPIKAKCSKTKHKRGKNLKHQTSSLRQKFMKLLSHSEFKDDGVSNTSLLAHFGKDDYSKLAPVINALSNESKVTIRTLPKKTLFTFDGRTAVKVHDSGHNQDELYYSLTKNHVPVSK